MKIPFKFIPILQNKFPINFSLLLIFFISINLSAQTISVNGSVISNRISIQNALVTFIDNSDTTIQFSSTTDQYGKFTIGVPTSIQDDHANLPTKFELEQSYPNPFSSEAAIPYKLKKESDVQVTIYDILGRSVRKFNAGVQNIGAHSILWDGNNNFGQKVASGIYFYKLQAGNESQVKKMIFSQSPNGLISLPKAYSSPMQESNTTLQKSNAGNVYKVRIENTTSTLPVVISQEFDNVLIQKDTSIILSVNYIPVATINLDSLHQIIRGFGASNILNWRPDMTTSEVETAFGTGDGQLGFNILRIMVEPDSNRWSLYLTTAKKAQALGAIVIASPWYAPTNMVETVNGVSRVKHDKYADYAAHLNAFTNFMTRNGVELYGISVQNEPDITDQWTSWTSDEMLTFMKENADAITGTRVMAPESFQFRRSMTDPILNDSAACANTDIICGHIYGGGLTDYPLARSKGKESWMTEYLINSPGSGANMDTSWAGAMATASSINSCLAANMSAYVWWYIVRYYGPIGDGTNGPAKGSVTKKGYVMSQFARFIRPGYYRVNSFNFPLTYGNGVAITAYKDPVTSKTVIVGVNTSSNQMSQVVRIQNGSLTNTFTTYTSSASKNCKKGNDVTMKDGNFEFIFEPLSITTFVSQ